LNSHMLRTVNVYVRGTKSLGTVETVDFIAVGKKGQQFLHRTGENVVAAFPALSNHPQFRDILPVSRMAIDAFRAGTYDHVVLIYMDFVSALLQEPTVKVLLPFSPSDLKEMVGGLLQRKSVSREEEIAKNLELPKSEYLFEPSPSAVLDTILPQLTEMQIYQGVLESAASEHSARMVAMRSATDNATDIIADLTLTYNQTRQASITAELAELSASKAALD
jgi:F-type H+-transporting ATPase subunit gamma